MRAFIADGIDKMGLSRTLEALPALLHLFIFLFFSGLVIVLCGVNQTVSLSVTWCIGLFSVMYVCVTFMEMLWHNSPYYTPLSKPHSIHHLLSCICIPFPFTRLLWLLICQLVLLLHRLVYAFYPETTYFRRARRCNSCTLWRRIERAWWIILA